MTLEKLDRTDRRRIVLCAALAAVCLFVGVKYFFLAFPEASIEFRETKQSSLPIARAFLEKNGVDPAGYTHAAVFGFDREGGNDEETKIFLEREVGTEEANRLLGSTIRLWRWHHRWFRPLQKEEAKVEVTTKGEVVGFEHLFPEEGAGPSLPVEQARGIAERFLAGSMGRPLDSLVFVESATEKRPHRTDHRFTWKLKGFEVKGADYRIEVAVAGDTIAAYHEFLKTPDAWARGYEELRSKNLAAGVVDSALLLFTCLAMIVLLVGRIRRGDVRWRVAAILGAVTCLLLLLTGLNDIPAALYDYDTTGPFAAFLSKTIILAALAGIGGGAGIFLVAAAAEPLYRDRFPRVLSLTAIVRPRALWTKEFFTSALVGLTLTTFFFAYENVFYLIANHFGAWSPRDVAYSDLLSTAFPWIYVLYFGWIPAISEEFISRMFSIPFFERVLRSRAVAIVLAAFIWGFGHAGYPNQPWWIRGVEVGLAGIIFGLVLLRFGIVAVVICHFSVDALYTAFALIRSPNPYFVVSGSLSAGLFALLFIVAIAGYLRRGGFLPASATNADEGSVPPPVRIPRPAPVVVYSRLRGRLVAGGLVVAAGLAALRLAPVHRFGEWVAFGATREKARDSAASFLRGRGYDVSADKTAVWVLDRISGGDSAPRAYLVEQGGLAAAESVYRDRAPTPLWRVRFFVPGQKEEYLVSVHTTTGSVLGFERVLAEDAKGASLDPADALAIGRKFADEYAHESSPGELKEQQAKDEKNRRDHTLVWEYPVAGAGDAKIRHEVVVQGDAVGSWGREVWIPEEWRRDYEHRGVLFWLMLGVEILVLGVPSGFAVVLFIRSVREGLVPWRFAAGAGAVIALAYVCLNAVNVDLVWQASQYKTAIPGSLYRIIALVGRIVGVVGIMALSLLLVGLAAALRPGAETMLTGEGRRRYGRDALVSGLFALGLAAGLPALADLFRSLFPAAMGLSGISWPASVASSSPLIHSVSVAAMLAAVFAAVGIVALEVLGRFFAGASRRLAFALLLLLAFLPWGPGRSGELLGSAIPLALYGAGAAVLAFCFLRDNPLAWLWTGWFVTGTLSALRLISQPAPFYRTQGALTLLVVVLPGLLLLKGGGTAPTGSETPR